MTMLDDQRDSTATDLSDADAALLARADWHASGGTLTGKQLAERYDRSARWGQKQRAAAEQEAADRAAGVPLTARPAPGGTPPDRSALMPPADRPKVNGTRRPAARGTEPERAPASLVAVTVLSVAVVLAVCAVVSYSHIRHLAEVTGSGHAALLPLALDGMVAACSCSLLVDRHRGTDGSWVARLGLVIGLASTLAANAAAVDPALVSPRAVTLALALYPPSALAVTGHLALRMLGER